MLRRTFLAASAATLLAAPALAEMLEYTDGLVSQRLAAGETVFVDFSAAWCGTCRAQGRAIEALRAENAAYDGAITFVKVDWDTWKSGRLASDLAIPRRSTLVVLKGDAELGRIVANTRKSDIKALMDTALGAAAS
ncbi:MAG: thioredoxin family protein [Pseudomonadota bacterium]